MGPSRPTLSRSAQATLFLLSLIISLVFIAFDPIVNPDAVTYLLSAEKYLEGGLAAAMAIHDWPFYAALIATTHQLTGLGLLHAAWLLNSIFLALLPLAIVQLCSNAGGTLRAQYFSAALVLLLPAVNDHRADLIRDLGYWCMMLWALAGLASYLRHGGGILSWQWLIAALAATLFRGSDNPFARRTNHRDGDDRQSTGSRSHSREPCRATRCRGIYFNYSVTPWCRQLRPHHPSGIPVWGTNPVTVAKCHGIG